MEPLVSTAWLAENLGKPGVVVFDATKYLPNEGRDGHGEYLQAHIPSARFFDIDEVADRDTDLPHMVPSAGRFGRLMEAFGVSNDSVVIFYDQKGLASSARGWWLMGLFGHDKAAVLDGGLPKWRAEGREVTDGLPAAPAPGHFVPAFRAGMLRGVGDVLGNLGGGRELVLDARPAGRFDGSLAEVRPGVASGHIPGSRNLPFGKLLNPDQTMRSKEELLMLLGNVGADGSRPVVTSCGSGVTATIITLAMTVAGLPAGAVYDGSWSEWGLRSDTPKAVGHD
jgi:thiosulfate/3-mercaptopyruvate sulfurtransferase